MAANSGTEKKVWRFRIIAYVLIVAILCVIVYATPKVTDAFDETMTIEYGNLKISDNITCYIVRDEVVYFAGENGKAGYYYDEATLARAGSQIVSVNTSEAGNGADFSSYNKKVKALLDGDVLLDEDSKDVTSIEMKLREKYAETDDNTRKQILNTRINELLRLADAGSSNIVDNITENQNQTDIDISQIGIKGKYNIQSPGYVSYKLDGYESEFNPDTMTLLDKDKVEKQTYKYDNICKGTAIISEPLYKVVDNTYWYGVTWISAAELGKYKEGKKITLNLPQGSVTGKVYQVVDKGEEIMVIMRFSDFVEGICSMRKVNTEIVTSDYSGLVVNNEFITSKEGVLGVYVVGITGETRFTPIKVRATDGVNSLVSAGTFYDEEYNLVATVSVYDEIQKP